MLEVALVRVLGTLGWSQRAALGLLGISRGSWHYRSHPRPGVVDPVPHGRRVSASWLDASEVTAIQGCLTAGFEAGKSVFQCFYEALDAGVPVASLSSWYRIARRLLAGQRPVRRRRTRRSTAMPQWEAAGPMQVWCWDITKLKGPYRGITFDLYLAIDAYSRLVVAWRVEDTESGHYARQMFDEAFTVHGGQPRIVHSDGGTSMTSDTLTGLFRLLGVEVSRNRPRVSNDNPYAESWFKTAKYAPTMPAWFDTIEQAREWMAGFVAYYNDQHRHSGLAGHTPASVHDGTWVEIQQVRQDTMDALRRANPGRYRRPLKLAVPYPSATLNMQPKPQDRLKTG